MVSINVVDNTPPIVSGVVADPHPVAVNTTEVTLTATIDDSETGGSNIASAQFSIDGGEYIAMSTQDGSFDQTIENVTAIMPVFADSGVFMISVRGTDSAGNVSAEELLLFAVFDPSGGFVVGGGWFNSPQGAYLADPLLTGRAHFGFVSRYNQGASVPEGQTQFRFKAGDMRFKSDSYQWLVVAHHKAQYKGVGTINDSENYGFMLTAIDEALTPSTDTDLFRISIWDEDNNDAIVYDNQMGAAGNEDPGMAIGAGNIRIQQTNNAAPAKEDVTPSLVVTDTSLLPAYPQPCNPDVWIPYQLDTDNQVIIRIYNATGRLVRTLNLGQKSAGFYIGKAEAAHWNGTNEGGEPVASGTYFITFQAGDFAATRKMLILK